MGLFGIFKPKAGTEPVSEEPELLKQIDTETAASDAVRQEAEPELALWLSNGTTVKSLQELADALKKMKAADYKEHAATERNEIAEWVQEVLNNEALARKLRKAKGKAQAALAVEKEIKALKAAAKIPKQPDFAGLKEEPMQIPEAPFIPEAEAKPKRRLPWQFKKKSKEEKVLEGIIPLPELPQITEAAESADAEKGKKNAKGKAKKQADELAEITEIPEISLPDEELAPEAEKPESMTPVEILSEPFPPTIEETKPAIPENPAKKEKRWLLFFGRKTKKEQKLPEEPAEKLEPIFPIEENKAEAPETHRYEPELQPDHEESRAMPAEEEPQQPKPKHRKTKDRNEGITEEDIKLERKLQSLERTEKELEKEEETLNSKRLEITRRRYDLIKQRGEIERERFERFISKQKPATTAQDIITLESSPEANETIQGAKGLPDFRLASAYGKERLEALLDKAKQHIQENSVAEAQAALREVQDVLSTVFMTGSEKKQIEYEILEVEADLKLASLK